MANKLLDDLVLSPSELDPTNANANDLTAAYAGGWISKGFAMESFKQPGDMDAEEVNFQLSINFGTATAIVILVETRSREDADWFPAMRNNNVAEAVFDETTFLPANLALLFPADPRRADHAFWLKGASFVRLRARAVAPQVGVTTLEAKITAG